MFESKKTNNVNAAANTSTNAATEKKTYSFSESLCDYAGLLFETLVVGSMVIGTCSAINKAMKHSDEFDKKYSL